MSTKFNRQLLTLPIFLIAGIVITSVLTTGTNVSAQSLVREKGVVSEQNLAVVEKIESQSSLKNITSKITSLGFVSAKLIQVRGGQDSLSMVIR